MRTSSEDATKPLLRTVSTGPMADGLDVVSFGIEDEGAVIARMIVLAHAGPAVVSPSSGDRRLVEGVDHRAIAGRERDMDGPIRLPSSDPEVRLASRAEARPLVVDAVLGTKLHDQI